MKSPGLPPPPPPALKNRYSWLSAAAAFLLWGSWAWLINAGAAASARLLAALAQGLTSLVITLIMVHAVTRLYRQFRTPGLRLVLPGVITVTVAGSFLTALHSVVGTPNVVLTITPPLSVALVFCIYTARRLQAADRGVAEPWKHKDVH